MARPGPRSAGLKLPADRSVLGLEPGDKVALDADSFSEEWIITNW